MRKIKFRVWDSGRKEWLHKYPFALYGETTLMGYIDVRESDGTHVRCEELNNLVPCQFTGLKDKNGTEIYEGDVVGERYTGGSRTGELIVERIGEVKIGLAPDMTINCNEYEVAYCGVWADVPGETNIEGRCNFDSWEVIGNIYENGDLLES